VSWPPLKALRIYSIPCKCVPHRTRIKVMMLYLWVLTPCRLVGTNQSFRDSMCLRNVGTYMPTSLQGVKTQKYNIVILTAVRTSDLTISTLSTALPSREVGRRTQYRYHLEPQHASPKYKHTSRDIAISKPHHKRDYRHTARSQLNEKGRKLKSLISTTDQQREVLQKEKKSHI
jgi:hypothetical protein